MPPFLVISSFCGGLRAIKLGVVLLNLNSSMEALILKEDNSQLQSSEKDFNSKGFVEEDPTSTSLKEDGFKTQEDHNSKNLKEEDRETQILREIFKLQSREENPKLQSSKDKIFKSRSLEVEEVPKTQRSEEKGQHGLADPTLDENALQLLDSMDGYLTLLDSLSWTLRQGWLQLASARHSMGGSRISSAVLDMKFHSAATILEVTKQSNPGAGLGEDHHFMLRKWASIDNGNGAATHKDASHQLRQRKDKDGDPPPVTTEDDYLHQLQKERFKSLSVFGALVSPKLRAAQLSFETALEAIVEIADMRSLMLSNFEQVRKELEAAKGNQ